MLEYLIKNKEWIFSGLGVSILTLILTKLLKKKKYKKIVARSENRFNNSQINNSTVNSISGSEINFNQTIYNEVKEQIEKREAPISIFSTAELEKVKEEFIRAKYFLRTNIYAALANSSNHNFDSIIEIRHILDEIEDKFGTGHLETLQELKDMKDDGIIEFILNDDQSSVSPYTRITLTKKFYSTITNLS